MSSKKVFQAAIKVFQVSTLTLALAMVFSPVPAEAYGGSRGGGSGRTLDPNISITDPYQCGKGMSGYAINGIMPFKIRFDFYKYNENNIFKTLEPVISNGNQFRIDNLHTQIDPGKYTVKIKVTDANEKVGEVSYTIDVKRPDQCTIVDQVNVVINQAATLGNSDNLIRTGGANMILPMFAVIGISMLVAGSSLPLIAKKVKR